MKILSIRLRNIYSYRDAHFVFPSSEANEKNVILIHGRNGYGKTSFINSLKLFFLGIADEELRTGPRSRVFTSREFFLGTGADWEGAFNRAALREKETECSVSVEWLEPAGRVVATRSWTIEGRGGVMEHLEVLPDFAMVPESLVEQDQRQEFIEQRLARTLVPFFIYDAEQVQRIAESNSEAVIEQIERLLDITSINTASEYLNKLLVKLRRESNARGEQLELERLRGLYEVERAKKGQIEAQIETFERDDVELKRRLKEVERRLKGSKATANEEDQGQVSEQIRRTQETLEEHAGRFRDAFPAIAPLVSHPALVRRALNRLAVASQGKAMIAEEIRSVLERLPSRLIDEPQHPTPALAAAQKRFLKQKMELLLEAEIRLAEATDDPDHWKLSGDRARKLDEQLRGFVANNALRDGFSAQLRDISKFAREEVAFQAQLQDLSSLPAGDRERQKLRLAEKAQLESESTALREQIGELKSQLIPTARALEQLRSQVNQQARRVSEATRNQLGVDLAERTREGILQYKESLKEARREEIAEAVNRHFATLMQSHGLVKTIEFDDDFRMTYLDADGKPVGMANISAGMKQLAAQALLWSLKDVAGTEFPVVIDTPLARIDAEHQVLLLTQYYPKAADQVIVLPTNSELTVDKYRMLSPYIVAEFKLNNETGESTVVESNTPMYALARAS
ncbi:AAA family ATPase [Paraburkholderia phosphatilytica]|uniref:AAA family ATPase n=1 Tax=Paraburkholderia phosphatilytica TaxID=2282883 RepID=UPI000E543656|nr:AAA family ATPase [Paraburkholderia phosphatilytica]